MIHRRLTHGLKQCLNQFLTLVWFLLAVSLGYPNVQAEPKQNEKKDELTHWVALAKKLDNKPKEPYEKQIWNLRDTDVKALINAISQATGKNFLIDPRVQGKITLISSQPVLQEDLYPLFLSALNMAGFSAVPHGEHLVKIVPQTEGLFQAPPLVQAAHAPHGTLGNTDSGIVIRLLTLNTASAEQLLPILKPFIGQTTGQINAYTPSNTLVMVGQTDVIDRMVELATSIDKNEQEGIHVVRLKNTLADDVVKTIRALEANTGGKGLPRFSLTSEPRSNAVLINANQTTRLRLRALIAELDKPIQNDSREATQIIYLRYLQAKDILPVLVGIVKSQYNGPVESMMGSQSMVNIDGRSGGALSQSTTPTPFSNLPINPAMGGSPGVRPLQIIGEPNNNAIILYAPPNIIRTLKHIIDKIDIRPTQVLIEAIIAQLDEDVSLNTGIDWGTTSAGSNTSASALFGSSQAQAGFGIVKPQHISKLRAELHALANLHKNHVLSTPSILVLDNHQATIKVGQQISIPTTSNPNNAGGTGAGAPYTTYDRLDVALELTVNPQISQKDGSIKLNIVQKNNTPTSTTSTSAAAPNININEIYTSVIVNDGDMLVFGGLISNTVDETDETIPILGAVPLVGQAFHHKNRQRLRKKLMVFLHPRIVKDQTDSDRLTRTKYLDIRQEQLALLYQDLMGDRIRQVLTYPHKEKPSEMLLPDYKPPQLPKPFASRNTKNTKNTKEIADGNTR